LLHKEDANIGDYAIIHNTLQKDPCNSAKEAVIYIYRQLRNSEPPDEATAMDVIDKLFFSSKRYDLGDVGRYRLNHKLNLSTAPDIKVLTKEDIIAIINHLIQLINSKALVDDIDHLSNRRIRTVGEQLANQFSVGLSRMARTIRERMNVRDNEVFTPIDLINAKTLSSVINSFFGTSQLSQFMDQTNPLAEMTHKRRLSALGPGGLSRDRAGFEVRDVHYTHYGRLCPIETPEGPNIGLISSLCVYARINDLGFIETPYRKVEQGRVDLSAKGYVYMSAEEEEERWWPRQTLTSMTTATSLTNVSNAVTKRITVVTKEVTLWMLPQPDCIHSRLAYSFPGTRRRQPRTHGSNMMRRLCRSSVRKRLLSEPA
jgi:DNA-directed RNA polymerase subunit beta